MEAFYKILDVLVEAIGPTAVKEHCDKHTKESAAPEQKKIIIKKVKKPTKADSEIEQLTAGLEGLSIQKATAKPPDVEIDTLTTELQGLSIQPPEVVQPSKPKAKSGRRCDARIYGEKFLIEGTRSPSGDPYAVYKHAQCPENASHSLTDEDDGKLYICKMCMKRYSSRKDYPVIWHGFFDVDDPPYTSHFINGPWHRAKLAAISA